MKIKRHLMEARAVSLSSDFAPVHIGCVITHNDKVISVGYNNNKSDPVQMRYNRHRNMEGHCFTHKQHAEMMALKKISTMDIDKRKVVVYNWREYKTGEPALSRPCPACMRFMKDLGITKIVYSTNNTDGYCVERI